MKLWEWELYRRIPAEHILAVPGPSASTHLHTLNPSSYLGSGKRMYSNIRAVDPLGLHTTAFNMCLTPAGLAEVLTRLATLGYKYYTSDVSFRDRLIHMLRLMNDNFQGGGGEIRAGSNNAGGAGAISVHSSAGGEWGAMNLRLQLKPFHVSFDP